MKNILIVTDKLFPDEIGGSCTYAYYTAISMQKAGYDVSIFTGYPDKKSNDQYFPNITIYRCLSKINIFKSSRQLLNVLNSKKYDSILFHSPISWFVYYLISRKKNIKTIAIYHGPWASEALLKYRSKRSYYKMATILMMKLIEKKYLKNVDRFIFLSNYMKNVVKKIDPKQSFEYRIIPGGVELKNYERKYTKQEAKKLLGISNETFLIFSLRRLEYRMGIQNALDAVNMLTNDKEINKKIEYYVGGKGQYGEFLQDKIKNENISCKLLGFVPDEELMKYFCAADLFLVPSIDLEGFGLVILESLAMGLPVLVTPQGGMTEIVDKLDNMFCTSDISSESVYKKIKQLIPIIKSNEVYYDNKIENYDWSNITKSLVEYMEE